MTFAEESARRLVRLRWVAVASAAILVVASGPILRLLPASAWIQLAACLAVLAGLNVAYAARGGVLLQIHLDLLLLTAMLHFSGGIANPLHGIYVFHVILGTIVLTGAAARGVTAAACILFTLLAVAEMRGWIPHSAPFRMPLDLHRHPLYVAGHLLAFNLILVCAAVFTSFIMARKRAADRTIEEVVNGAGVGMRLLSPDRRILWQNQSVEEWFQAAHAVGKPCLAAFGKPVMGCRTCLCEEAIRSSGPVHGERTVVRRDGARRHYAVTASPIFGASGELLQIVELVRDVTEEKETAAQLVQAAKMTAIGELAGSVAHEVNNPVGIIVGKTKLLLREELPARAREELEKIDRQAGRIADVARRLLDFSRPSSGRRESLDANAAVEESLQLSRARLEAEGIRLKTDLAADLPRISGCSNEVQHVLLNLVNNAVDAMGSGGTLRIRTSRTNGWVEIEVSDSGGGIPKENLERIFDPFFTTKGPRGTGLGLAIVKKVVRDHGGEVLVESEVGRGSAFRVLLPEAQT